MREHKRNNPLEVLVIDDEDNAANWLSEHITDNFSELKVVGVGNSVSEGGRIDQSTES